MRRVTAIAVGLLFSMAVPCPAPSHAQSSAPNASPIELRITGPHLIHLGDNLKFTVTLKNRTNKTIALRFPHSFLDDTQFDWRVTDSGRRLLPQHVYDTRGWCPIVGPVTDREITTLEPGQSTQTDVAGDPSDFFFFTGKGFYRVTLRFTMMPTYGSVVCKLCPPLEKPEPYTPEQKIEMLKKTPSFEVSSNEWHMYLTD